MPIEMALVVEIGTIVVFFSVGTLFFYIGLHQKNTYHLLLERELTSLFLVNHTLLKMREKELYRPEKAQEVWFAAKRAFFETREFSLDRLYDLYEQTRTDILYLGSLLQVSVKELVGLAPHVSFFRIYLLFGTIFVIGTGVLVWYFFG